MFIICRFLFITIGHPSTVILRQGHSHLFCIHEDRRQTCWSTDFPFLAVPPTFAKSTLLCNVKPTLFPSSVSVDHSQNDVWTVNANSEKFIRVVLDGVARFHKPPDETRLNNDWKSHYGTLALFFQSFAVRSFLTLLRSFCLSFLILLSSPVVVWFSQKRV